METMSPLRSILRLNTRLFENCLAGMEDAQVARRGEGGTNSMAFIALHAADARYYLLGLLGGALENPFARFASARSQEDIAGLPGCAELRSAWRAVFAALDQRFAELGDEEWSRPSAASLPVEDATVAGATAFLLQHESYHIGQLALLRRQAGCAAMRYD